MCLRKERKRRRRKKRNPTPLLVVSINESSLNTHRGTPIINISDLVSIFFGDSVADQTKVVIVGATARSRSIITLCLPSVGCVVQP